MSLKGKESKPIVHIATDEKFIDAAYDIYEEAFPGKNLFLILLKDEHSEIMFLSKENEYYFINTNSEYTEKVQGLTDQAHLIVFHGMNFHQAVLAQILDSYKRKFIWSVFGGEVYNNQKIFNKESIGEKTYKEFAFSIKKWVKDQVRPYYYSICKRKKEPLKVILDSFSRMDYASILYKEELDNYQRLGIVNPEIEYIKYTYYPLDIIINKNSGFINAGNILLGNSASYTNNHLEAFDILDQLKLESQKVITTLSYGNKEYANQIINIGKKKFSENFVALTEFLPLHEYQKILQSCGIVIMNHYRQQAIGNVMNAIYLGAKVYLSNKNTLFHYLKSIGCHILSVEEDLVPGNKTAFDLLSKKQMIKNREILKKELSLDRIVSELQVKLNQEIK